MKQVKFGFTLIELLVVIAIIAILAAILFPVFAQAREKARQTSCLSNCKQMGTATQLYIDDYDETYPPSNIIDANADLSNTSYPWYVTKSKIACPYNSISYCQVNDAWSNWTWRDSIFPYVKNVNMYYCPSVKNIPAYGINLYLTCPNGAWNTSQPKTVSELKNTSELVLYTRCQQDSLYCRAEVTPNIIWIDGSGCGPCHNGGDNITYADGHAKFCKKGQGAFSHNVGWALDDNSLVEWNPALQN